MGDAGQVYDGFISYSHAADDLLAPRLQSALQRFAKPWWKRRAVRIFRDESSLSANPHLWSSITEALDTSGWFVLLLSPDAARSEWVNQEIAYWVANRDPKKILPVVTDGEFGWSGGDVTSDAVPDALRGVFSEEPRWVDVRWAKDEDQLDLQDPRFADAVADIASTIRGIPKDDLASEEVRQHRRTVRTAWAAGSLVGVLAMAAVGFGIQSARNSDEADAQAGLAKARELAASSISVRESDPELATLLAIEAIRTAGGGEDSLFAEGLISLRNATYSNHLLGRRSYRGGGRVDVAFTSDGSGLLVTSESDRSVSLISIEDLEGEPIWTFRDPTTNDRFLRAVPNPAGTEVALIVVDRPFAGDPGPDVQVDAEGSDGMPGRIVLLDAQTGTVVRVVVLEGCVEPLAANYEGTNRSGYSPAGTWFHLLVEGTECAEPPAEPLPEAQTGFWDTVILETSTWKEVRRLSEIDGLQFGEISFTSDETKGLVNFEFERTELRSFPDFELLKTFEFTFDVDDLPPAPAVARVSPDGERFSFTFANFGDRRPGFWDIDEDVFLGWGDRYDGLASDTLFTPSGSVLAFGSDSIGIYDPVSANLLLKLPTRSVNTAGVSPDGTLAATASSSGDVELWTLDPRTALVPPSGNVIGWINPNEIIEGEDAAIRAFADPSGIFIVEPTTGKIKAEFSTWAADVLPDGRYVMSRLESHPAPGGETDEEGLWEGPLIIRDLAGDSVELLQDCVGYIDHFLVRADVPDCPDGSPMFTATVRVSHDGSRIAAMAVGREVRIWDVETLEIVRTLDPVAGDGLLLYGDGWLLTGPRTDTAEDWGELYVIDTETGETLKHLSGSWRGPTNVLSHDGSRLFIMEAGGRAFEFDTSTWEPVRDWQAQQSNSRGIAVSPDDSMLAVSGEDGLIVIWRTEGDEPELVQRIPAAADRISDIFWIDEDRLGAALVPDGGEVLWQVINLSTEAVVDEAIAGLVRGFTDIECDTYRINPCPALDEMRSR